MESRLFINRRDYDRLIRNYRQWSATSLSAMKKTWSLAGTVVIGTSDQIGEVRDEHPDRARLLEIIVR